MQTNIDAVHQKLHSLFGFPGSKEYSFPKQTVHKKDLEAIEAWIAKIQTKLDQSDSVVDDPLFAVKIFNEQLKVHLQLQGSHFSNIIPPLNFTLPDCGLRPDSVLVMYVPDCICVGFSPLSSLIYCLCLIYSRNVILFIF